ncbi:hypothetical protein EIP86_000970 [Pleurotus ostreatoroseus]|nr:hypothetical protein EIP86_000970 [Pleurotus ostreatoroseus]
MLRGYANPPIGNIVVTSNRIDTHNTLVESKSAPADRDIIKAANNMKIRLGIHGCTQIMPFTDVYDASQRYGAHWEMAMIPPECISMDDLVVLECRMIRQDISGSHGTLWETKLELMGVALWADDASILIDRKVRWDVLTAGSDNASVDTEFSDGSESSDRTRKESEEL